jgi:hypothetical protein
MDTDICGQVKKIQKILDYELDSEFICPSVEVDFNITQ